MTYIRNSNLDDDKQKSIDLEDIIFNENEEQDLPSKFISANYKDLITFKI